MATDNQVTSLAFRLVGNDENEIAIQSFQDEPTLVVIDNKIVLATGLVQPQLAISGLIGPAKLGELVILEAQLSNHYKQFIVAANIKWDVTDSAGQKKQSWTEDKKIIFGAGVVSTIIHVTASLTLTYVVGTSTVDKVVTTSMDVQVGDAAPLPGPNPGPQPDGIAGMAASWARDPAVVQPDGAMLSKGAQALSKSFKSVSEKIGQDGLTNVKSILTLTKSNNNDALMSVNINPTAWDNWGKKLQAYLFAEYTAKRLVTVDQFKKAWYDISTGLWTIK
jgi:hypothetical protein